MRACIGVFIDTEGIGGGVFMSNMGEWAREKAEALKKKQADSMIKQEVFNETQRQKQAQGPDVWDVIAKKCQEACNAVNAEMGRPCLAWSREADKSVAVQGVGADRNTSVRAQFHAATCAVSWDCRSYVGKINDSGKLVFCPDHKPHMTLNAEGVAQDIVTDALDKIQ